MYTFYNPKKSALSISLNYQRKCGILEIAPTLNPNHRGQIQKGQQLFDWQNKLVFTIGPEEAPQIIKFIYGHLKKEFISFTHAPTGNTREKYSVLTVSGKHPWINVTISVTEANQPKKQYTFTLRETETLDEISIFVKFLKKIIETPFIEDYLRFAFNFSQQLQQ